MVKPDGKNPPHSWSICPVPNPNSWLFLSTFCVDDTPASTQLRLTTKDTGHMKDNALPGQNKKKTKYIEIEIKQALVMVYEV